MQYSKLQRFTSFFILFFFLFGTTFHFPISDSSVFADDESYKNIVSIIVNEDIYSSIKGSLSIYSNNISEQLENTKVVILPTPSTTSAYEIASLNESLYFEGLESIDNTLKNGKLIGTVLVGELNLPVAYENTDAQKTIVPYVDFEDKYFIYNHESGKFEKNESNINGLGVEIWHGIISPNLGNQEDNIEAIKNYFSKNNDYYKGEGLFADDKGVINGDLNSSVSEKYEPYVFYFDQIRETKALNLENYSAYQAFQENKEDILYKRYNQELADKISERVIGSQDDSLESLQNILGDSIDLSEGVSGPDMLNIPDIQTRHIINQATKTFVEIFSQGSIGELRKNVHNAGRYNYPTNNVNVDFIPYLVTILDSVNDEIIKEANNDIEGKIDELIKKGLSRDIAIPTKFVNTIDYRDSIINEKAVTCDGDPEGTFNCIDTEDNSEDNAYGDHYTNIYFGTQGKDITLPEQCTIYRGSRDNNGTIVRANRSYNVDNIQGDIDRLNNYPGYDIDASECFVDSGIGLNGYFGRNTGLYLDKTKSSGGELILKSGFDENGELYPPFDENGALIPLFDIKGSKSINDTLIKEPSYLNCLDSNYYLTKINKFEDNGDKLGGVEIVYQTPLNGANPINWTCKTINEKDTYNESYDSLYRAGKCRDMICIDGNKTINFNQIPSYMEHKAPTVDQLGKEIQAGVTPSLPIDRDRYIDFMANDDSYQKVNYEYLFRNFTGKTFNEIAKELKTKLDVKSNILNIIITSTDGNFPILEESVRVIFNDSIGEIRTSISEELDFEDNMNNKESDIIELSGTGSVGGNIEDNGILGKDNDKIIEQSEQLKLNTLDLKSEKDLFIALRIQLIEKKNKLVGYINEFDTELIDGKYCRNGNCENGWLSILDKYGLEYEVSILEQQLSDYQTYIDKLESLIYKLEIQKNEMDLISLKFKLQIENLSQLWSTLEYDKNGISPIYEELNQRIKELDESEKSYEITDKTTEIQERIDYLFSVIDTLDISEEESAVVNLSNNIKFDNDNIINIFESKSINNQLVNEYVSSIQQGNEVLILEKALSQKKLQLANSIKNISNLCSVDAEGNVDKDRCKQVFERIEELKISEPYVLMESEISELQSSINAKNQFLTGSYVLGTTSNVTKIISQVEDEKSELEVFRKQFNIDSLNINTNIDSINNGLDSVNNLLISSVDAVKGVSDNIEQINDELNDIDDLFKNKVEEIKILDNNILKTTNDIKAYLSSNDIDGNPYLELYNYRNSLVFDRDNLKIKENELDGILVNLKDKRNSLSSEILKLKGERVKLLNIYNSYNTKKENRKIYSCIGEICDKWISEISYTSIGTSLELTKNIIDEYDNHLVFIDTMLGDMDVNDSEIDVLISDVLQEIDNVDTYIFELRKDDQEYKKSYLETKQSSFTSKNNVIIQDRNHINDIIGILKPFTELKDIDDDYINTYRLTAIDQKFSDAGYNRDNYFVSGDIKTARRQVGADAEGNSIYEFDYYYVTRSNLLGKLEILEPIKVELDKRIIFSNTYLSNIADKISEKSNEITTLNNLISDISNDKSDDTTIKNNIQNLLDIIKLDTDSFGVSHVNFTVDKLNELDNYFLSLDELGNNLDLFFTDKLRTELIIPTFNVLDKITRTSYYLGNPATVFSSFKNNIIISSNKVIGKIGEVHTQFDNIFIQILSVQNTSNIIGKNYYEGLIGTLDTINSGILSSGNFIYRKEGNFNINKQLSDINSNVNDIKLHIFNSNNEIDSVYKSSVNLWLKLIGIENYNKDDIRDYSINNIEPNIVKVDDIDAKEFYGWTNDDEKVGIIGEGGKGGNLDEDTQEFYQVIDEHIVDLRSVEIYEDFRTSEKHPEANVDLYGFLLGKDDKELIIGSDQKTITYEDSLAFAIYWNNLDSVSAKYKFIFEHYLDDQFVGDTEGYNFPKNKKQYEIAYLGANGDAENMYIQMNPESKGENPYKEIVQKNAELQTKLLGQNIIGINSNTDTNGEEGLDGNGEMNNEGETESHQGNFQCAPPEGVPIYEWIPAVVCWLDDMLPPTITVSDSTCGPTLPLLSNEDKEYLEQCNGDVDKNGVNDCLENKLKDGGIESFSDSNRVYYNKSGKITSQLFDDASNILTFDSNTKVSFNVVKIEIPKDSTKEFTRSNTDIVFSEGDDESIINKYINFSPSTLAVKGGIVETQFTSKGFDANYYFQSSLEVINNAGEKEISKKGEIIKVEVRGDRLFSTLYNISENRENGEIVANIENNNITVSDSAQLFLIDKNNTNIDDVKKQIFSSNTNPDKMVVSLNNISKAGNTLKLVYPLSVSIINSKDSKILESISINSQDLKSFYSLPNIEKAGHYVLEIKDANGFVAKKELDFVSDEAVRFEVSMGATVLESDGAISSNVITILDKFDNPVIGKTNTLDINIDGKNIVFEHNNENNSTSQVVEGYKIFRLKSLDKTGLSTINFNLKDFFGKSILKDSVEVKVVDSIFVKVLQNDGLKVGGNTYKLQVQIEDENGSIYKDINSRLYFNINNIYGTLSQPYFDVKNGIANVEITTTGLASQDIPVEIQVEGLRKIFNDSIKINHDVPVYIQLGMEQYAVEADPSSNANIDVYLKDQYGNITFDINSGGVQLEILPEYEKYISSNGSSQINKGISNIKISGTEQPGMAYFKVSYNGIDAIGKINTYYYWNNSTIENTSYNSLYTTLLGAPYGDITKENYLAGSLLFNDNRSLAVTSLLNSPYEHNDVVMIDNKGAISSVASKNDLSTDINFNVIVEDSKLLVSIKNSALGNYIGKIQPVLGGNTELKLCNGNNGNLGTCEISEETTSIILQSDTQDFNGYSDNDSLYIQDSYGRKIFSIDKEGNIERKEKIYFDLESNNVNLLQIGIYLSGNKIGTLGYNFVDAEIKSTRNSDLFTNTANSISNTILILLAGGNYASRDVYNNGNDNKIIYFNSPFDSEHQLNDFSKGNMSAYENFEEKGGLGWTEGNKSLLQFSAGENVGESVKMYQSFSVVNLGDPVVSLKKIQRTLPKKTDTLRKFDSTLGKLISNTSTVESYTTFDYNNDKKEDLLLIHTNKYFELLENTSHEKDFVSKGNLAQIYDLGGSNSVKGGDFTGDGYYDIFFVNDQGNPFILNNINKDFIRIPLTNQVGGAKIIRSEVFDMDNDGKHDIVVLDEKGDINIYFGGGTSQEPKFLVKNVGNAGMPELNSTPRTDNGALYFDGLVSLGVAGDNSELLKESEAFQNAIQENTQNLAEYQGNGVNTTALDALVFVQIPYKSSNIDNSTPAELLVDSINIPTSPETVNGIEGAKNDLTDLLNNSTNSYIYPESNPEVAESDFMKSEYVETLDIEIGKVYSGELTGGSNIDFSLTIKNNSNKNLNNIAYVEDILTLFTLDQTTITTSKDVQLRYDIPGYDFMVDNFNLAPGESFTLSAKLLTAPIKYGHIQVGLFETGEVGDDAMGDIFYSASHESCGETKMLFRSCGVDSNNNGIDDCSESTIKPGYIQGTKTPKCNESKIALPEDISKNVEDTNGNGIPDYIDVLTNGTPEEQQAYAQSVKNQIGLDSDGDGVPDNEDLTNSTKDFLSNLDEIEDNIDHVLAGVDNLIQGFSCGFGGGGCIATPLNWAPLAPGGDPTLFGTPIGDGLNIDEGLPIFSSLTWMYYGPYCLPAVWPISPLSEGCSDVGAGGYLGVDSPSNFFRLFATPTLTGGFGVAACFGGPARVAGYSNMPGLHPLLPGGNCIVTAMPLSSCSNDGSDGDPGSVGFAAVSGSSNMLGGSGGGTGGIGASGGSTGNGGGYGIVNANCSPSKNQNTDLDLELVQEYLNYKSTGVKSDSFEDRFKESLTKISHPDSANIGIQLNEPLIQVNGQGLDDELALNIDFGSIKSGDFSDIIQVENRRISAFPDFLMGWVTRQIEEIVNKLTDFPTVFIILPDFSGVLDFGETEDIDKENDVISADDNINGFVGTGTVDTVNSGIKEAYSFLSNIPLITIEQESLSVEIPWVDSNEVEATIEKWGATKDQWVTELNRAKEAWSLGAACKTGDTECENNNAASQKIIVQTEGLIGSLEQNLEVIKTYKDFPKKLNTLVKKKEDYLEQILCNVESISEILGGWIGSNGERFKAWVELYILIKAILKSWQLLIDVFVDYEAECYECKNERGDLMTFIWKIISVVIPKIPVIQFPKWPDIIMDLHNIRAGLTISLPEFTFGTRPILLPSLPNLYLPDVPTVSVNLPELPILPVIDIPELPDLPVLPTVELPNLPPPPTLPKMFSSLESILEILKAITKAMCILKTSPFIPEWRAGDQIAFLTERQGYLPTDFIDLSTPQFSFPFVDAIKVTTFVNLEFETDFVTELARQITMPLTTFSNDFTAILNLGVDDLDFSQVPAHIDINIGGDGVEGEISYSQEDLATGFAVYVSKGIGNLVTYLDTQKNVTVSNSDFKLLVSEALSSDVFVSHPKYNSFRSVWDEVFEYNFDKEDTFIADLQKNNFDKFQTLENILHTEILKNKELENHLEDYIQPSFNQKVDAKITSDVDTYNSQLEIYNQRFIDSAQNLKNGGVDPMVSDLEQRGEKLLARVSSPLSLYNNGSSPLAVTATSLGHVPSGNQCQEQASSPYRYDYKGLYTIENVEGEDYSYLLFDYLDDLTGKEEIRNIDSDNDGDIDVIYMMNGQIFLKENLEVTNHNSGRDVTTISSDDNPFYNGDIYYSSVDNFREGIIDNNVLNANFSASSNKELFNYRMTFSRLIDQTTERKSIIDGFTDADEITFDKENEIFSFGKNLAYIKNIGKLKNLVLHTKEFINIKKDLEDGNIVDISTGTKIHAGNQAFRLTYMIDGSTEQQIIVVGKNQFIELKNSIKIIGISGDAYIEGRYDITLKGEEIRAYKGLPLSLGTHIEFVGDIKTIDPMTYIEISYYDESEALLNFNFIEEYWLYDLGIKQDRLTFSLNMDNDYLYAKLQSFNKNIFSTYSNQIVLSPQKEADDIAPELHLTGIEIPVYQEKTISLGDLIYEDGGIKGLKEVIIDMDLETDSNGDGNLTNDADIPSSAIKHTSLLLEVTFGEYDYLTSKEIGITLVDENNNSSYSQIPFEIYSPRPEIETINELGLVGVIDEDLDDEPVSLYRYRGGIISKLNNTEGSHKVWTQGGDYKFKVDEENTGLTLDYSGVKVAEILEKTGKIILKDFSSKINVYSSNHQNNNSYYPKIEIDKNGNTIYYQYLQVAEGKTINVVENFDTVSNAGMYMKFTDFDNYGYYQIPETVSYNPGAFVIYRSSDINKEPLFIIYPDGKINTLNEYYTLEYSFENDYIVLNLIDKHYNTQISQLLFSIDGGYIMK